MSKFEHNIRKNFCQLLHPKSPFHQIIPLVKKVTWLFEMQRINPVFLFQCKIDWKPDFSKVFLQKFTQKSHIVDFEKRPAVFW